jgi:hypothetical protein
MELGLLMGGYGGLHVFPAASLSRASIISASVVLMSKGILSLALCWYSGQIWGLGPEASTWIMLGTGGKDLNIRPCRASSTILDADCSYPRRTFGLGM